MYVSLDARPLPVLHDCDVVVAGGSLGGVAAALGLARAGRRVAVVEPRTYVGREITATLRPWVPAPADGDPSALPPLISALVEASGASPVNGEFPLHMDAVKLRLEDELLDAGVKLVYASRPVGLYRRDGALRGIVIGNKSGRQVLTCRAVLDASATALICRLVGAEFRKEADARRPFARTVEFEDVGAIEGDALSVPADVGLGDSAIVHRGYRGESHVLLEHHVLLPACTDSALDLTHREAQARRRTQALVTYLHAEVPAFEKAVPGVSSHELHGSCAPRMTDSVSDWARPLGSVAVPAPDAGRPDDTVSACAFAGPIPGLWCLNDAARLDEDALALAREPVGAARIGRALAVAVHEHWDLASAPGGHERRIGKARGAAPAAPPDEPHLEVGEQDRPQVGRTYDLLDVEALSVPVLHTADVLVVGGGSSGSVAALVAARQGMRTVLVDMNPGLGGTGTFGGIDLLWFPRPIGPFAELYDRISEMQDRLGLPRPQGIMPSYNIAARLWVLMDAADEAGVEMLFNSVAIATIVEGSAVRGVVVATPTGPVAVLGKVMIDATGDGDVAAFAGAEHALGSERDHTVMYALMPGSDRPGRFLNIKTSMLDVTNVEDYTRMILVERRRQKTGETVSHDHGIYLAPRESRHITGGVTLTLTDQLLKRCWPDVVYVAFSNCDMKGQTTSDWHRMGLQCPNLEIEIPYRALLPRGLDSILVAGKAYSATHDAIAAPRMQPDLENLGGVVGHAAVMAVRNGTTPKRIDVRSLQAELVEKGLMPERVLDRQLVPLQYSEDELTDLIDSLDGEKPLHSYSDMTVGDCFEGRVPIVDILCSGPRVVPLLEKALAGATGPKQVLLARALATLGSTAGVDVLISAIEGHLAEGRLPERTANIRHAGLPPNQCAGPDVAYLLYSLGMARDERALPIWRRIVDMLENTTEAEIVDRYASRYYYVDSVCYGAERLGDPQAVPILKRLHAYAPFHGRECHAGYEVDWFGERIAHLELVIGRSLARCGSAEGYAILIAFLNDVRAVLAEHAHAELAAICGCDLGKDVEAWESWLAQRTDRLKPAPWTGTTDAVACWDEDVLTDAHIASTDRE